MLPLLLMAMPCISCIFLFLAFATRTNRTQTENILTALTLCSSIYFFAEYNYVTAYRDYHTFVIADALSQFARPCITPLMTLSILSLIGLPLRRGICISFSLAAVIGSVSMVMYTLMGFDHAAKFIYAIDTNQPCCNEFHAQIGTQVHFLYKFFCIYLYQAINILFAIICISRISWLFYKTNFKFSEIPDFLFRKGEIEPAHLMGILYIALMLSILIKMYLGRHWFVDHQTATVLFCIFRTVLVLMIGNVGLHSRHPSLSFFLLHSHPDINQPKPKPHDNIVTEPIVIRDFYKIISDKLFLNPHLTIEDASRHVSTNRTYLSQYIQQSYNLSFREYINSLRIDYAKQYYLHHPDIIQDALAEACGFPDAPSLNKKFKSLVGTTPRLWLAAQQP